MQIAGANVLIVGAAGGIGSAIARQLAEMNANLFLVARSLTRLHTLADELRPTGVRISLVPADLIDTDAPRRIATETLQRAGNIDILINCAGIQNFGFFADEVPADTATLFHINTVAPLLLVNALLPHMLAHGSGQIVNVGSIFGSIGFPCFASYSASKFALRGFSEALRRELVGTGVGVTYVAPRFTKTPFNRDAVTRMAQAMKMNQDAPESVAADIIRAISHDRRDKYLGWPERIFVRLNALLPRLVDLPLMNQVSGMRAFTTGHSK